MYATREPKPPLPLLSITFSVPSDCNNQQYRACRPLYRKSAVNAALTPQVIRIDDARRFQTGRIVLRTQRIRAEVRRKCSFGQYQTASRSSRCVIVQQRPAAAANVEEISFPVACHVCWRPVCGFGLLPARINSRVRRWKQNRSLSGAPAAPLIAAQPRGDREKYPKQFR